MYRMSQPVTALNEMAARLADRFALKVIALHDEGLNQTQIANKLGLTRQRISQILKRAKARGLILE